MSASPADGDEGTDDRLSRDWSALVAGALEPGGLGSPAGDVIQMFGDLGFAELLTNPGAARDQCIDISETFAGMCRHRGIPAQAVTGFLIARVPPFPGEVVVCGHTAVQLPAQGPDGGRELVIDWTARQYDPNVRVPLVVTLKPWRAIWRDLAAFSGCRMTLTRPAAAAAGSAMTQAAARPARGRRIVIPVRHDGLAPRHEDAR